MNRLISSRLVMFLGLLITSMSIVTEISYAQTSPSKTIWGCSAGNSKLQYVVDQLDRNANRDCYRIRPKTCKITLKGSFFRQLLAR